MPNLRILLAITLFGLARAALVAQPVAPAVPVPQERPALPANPSAPPATFGQPAQAVPSPAPRAEETQRLAIRRLIGADAPIMLRTTSAIYTVFVPKSARFDMKTCRLHLEFTNSIALLSERSVLRVVLNDVIIGQFYLERENPRRVVDLDIPV
ncbi:MAG: cellulose biosynthesis cyclic di-GMP-binding regulatory protein BcsB, partial [Terrimicrobiaceae bacterium]|nr:cellulose biosynthesis cyclic di-GMP-binding regulatory protein BcsB [Terrimicrobiaceae bacterium]